MKDPLEELIARRETELQRVFDFEKAKHQKLEAKIRDLSAQRDEARAMMDHCQKRAAEVGLAHIL